MPKNIFKNYPNVIHYIRYGIYTFGNILSLEFGSYYFKGLLSNVRYSRYTLIFNLKSYILKIKIIIIHLLAFNNIVAY